MRPSSLSLIFFNGEKDRVFNLRPRFSFFASKNEAFENRGNNDYYTSKDIEDIVTVLDGTLQLNTILADLNEAAIFVKKSFEKLGTDNNFIQSLTGHIENGDSERAQRIYNFMKLC